MTRKCFCTIILTYLLTSVPDFNGVTAVVSQWCMVKVDRGPVCENLEHLTSSEESCC